MLLLDRKKSPNVQIDAIVTDNEKPKEEIPAGYRLMQNYPNPFNPTTQIAFTLPRSSEVTLEVFDMLGRRVAVLEEQEIYVAGSHQVTFNANRLASGVFIYRLKTDNITMSKKMILIK
jgi:hypothetical protein